MRAKPSAGSPNPTSYQRLVPCSSALYELLGLARPRHHGPPGGEAAPIGGIGALGARSAVRVGIAARPSNFDAVGDGETAEAAGSLASTPSGTAIRAEVPRSGGGAAPLMTLLAAFWPSSGSGAIGRPASSMASRCARAWRTIKINEVAPNNYT